MSTAQAGGRARSDRPLVQVRADSASAGVILGLMFDAGWDRIIIKHQ